MRRTMMITAATAITLGGLLGVAPAAQAEPDLQLKCSHTRALEGRFPHFERIVAYGCTGAQPGDRDKARITLLDQNSRTFRCDLARVLDTGANGVGVVAHDCRYLPFD